MNCLEIGAVEGGVGFPGRIGHPGSQAFAMPEPELDERGTRVAQNLQDHAEGPGQDGPLREVRGLPAELERKREGILGVECS